MRPSQIIAALFLVPGLLIIGFQVMMAVKSTQLMGIVAGWDDMIEDGHDRGAPPEVVKVEGRAYTIMTPEGGRVDRVMEAMLKTPEKAMEHRTAAITLSVTANSMLKEGEALPDPGLIELMVNARAARLAEDSCALMLETIAARCVVTHVNASAVGRGDDEFSGDSMFTVRSSLAFLPKDPLGTLPEGDTLVVHQLHVNLDNLPLDDFNAGTVRKAMGETLTAFANACTDMRDLHGNCMVLDPRLSVSARHDGSLTRSMRLVYLAPMQVSAAVEVAPSAAPSE